MAVLRRMFSSVAFIRVISIFSLLLLLLGFSSYIKSCCPKRSHQSYDDRKVLELTKLLAETKRKNLKLKKVIESSLSQHPSNQEIEYVQLRRRIRSNIEELHNFLGSELANTSKSKMASEHRYSLLNDLDKMQRIDGYEQWRHIESNTLSDLVQQRLKRSQNPKDCGRARKLVCQIENECGFGCQLHHVVFCLLIAYATERTLILKSARWGYHEDGWDDIFKPLSDTCTDSGGSTYQIWDKGNSSTQVLELFPLHVLKHSPKQLPLTIPEDLAPRLMRLHGDPFVWWAGQFIKYALRFQPKTEDIIQSTAQNMDFQSPIVGVHIRRTDKIETEASLHTVEEYMTHVNEYFDRLEMIQDVQERRIFLASDEIKIIDEVRRKYPHYTIVFVPNAARTASFLSRYSDSSLYGVLLDIHLLSQSDYIVCTFSSQMCRVAYELMQTLHPDASDRFKSLDDIYFFAGQIDHKRIAVLPHQPQNIDEIEMNTCDLISIAGNHWNGFSKGRNLRTNKIGLFPSFKVVDKIETAPFPQYLNSFSEV